MFSIYATLAQVRNELKAQNTVDDDILWPMLIQASQRLDAYTDFIRPIFEPWIESRRYLLYPMRINSNENSFNFGDPLLELSGASVASTSYTTSQLEGWPSLRPPYKQLVFTSYVDSWYRLCGTSARYPTVTISGTWGYHRDYANAWLPLDALVADISASATTLTVSDADGVDYYGITPRFSRGNLIRIGTEYMRVVGVDIVTNVLTVRRGLNGSTAAAHTALDSIDVWQMDPRITRIVARQVGSMYARRGAYQTADISDVGTVQYPADLLGEFRAVMNELAYI